MEAEALLPASGQSLDTLILKVSHYGANISLTGPLLEAASPELAPISPGAHSRFGHSDESTLEKMVRTGTYNRRQLGATDPGTRGKRYRVRTGDQAGRVPWTH